MTEGFDAETARKLTLVGYGGAAVFGALFLLTLAGLLGAESRSVLLAAFGLGAAGDLAFVGYVRWRRRQAIEREGMYGAAPKP